MLHFFDNTRSLYQAVHGYARGPEVTAVVNSLHARGAGLGVEARFEWVLPSRAGVSGLPLATRRLGATGPARQWRRPAPAWRRGVCPREPRPPTAAQLDDPAFMLAGARSRAGDAAADWRRAVTFLCGLMGGPP